jgi:hypothetical protein
MAMDGDILFSVIIPSTGKRPNALQKAVHSVEAAARFAGLETGQIEILIGFGGIKGKAPACAYPVRRFNLPKDDDCGHGIRNLLLKLAGGQKIIFLDDDNVLKPYALSQYIKHYDAEMIIGRIDTQLAFDIPTLPVSDSGALIRPGNIDLLCLCLSRCLVVNRCGGWNYRGKAEADFLNILDWYTRTGSVTILEEVIGVYDAGRSLDRSALSWRQQGLLDRLAGERAMTMGAPVRPVLHGLALA